MSVRKHFYLITEHENCGKVGAVAVYDNRMATPLKNEEGTIDVMDKETSDFKTIGKKVGLGYHDFESEAQYEDPGFVGEIMQDKVRGVDRKWAEKAGIVDIVYNFGD